MDKPEYIQTLVQAAMLYYNENMTQQEIAAKLGTTRQSVSKLISEARNRGIVEIRIHNPLEEVVSLSRRLAEAFRIQNAHVVPGEFADESLTRSIVAQKGVELVNGFIRQGCRKIGLSWGRTVYSFLRQFHSANEDQSLDIFPLLGASSKSAPYFMINEMVRQLAEKAGGTPNFIYVPVYPGSPEDYSLFTRTRSFQEISELWEQIDLAVVSIGLSLFDDSRDRQEYPGEKEMTEVLSSLKAAGDICTHYFDIHGDILTSKELPRLIRISEASLRKAGRVLAMVNGIEKADAILGALRTGMISDLVIDEKTARTVLSRLPQTYL